ncbi:MAG TPA: type IX secretion system membrane protein PorP/SprF, partial [Chitinophagales bacterium]|nr:type IX secretion system membrane protein PorP/SprF [Chitinophagales bacterium]
KESFSDKDNRLGIRPVVSAIAFTRINKQLHLEPSFEFMYQKKAQEYIINVLAGITLLAPSKMKNSIILIGSAYRPRDAWIPLAGMQWKTLRVILNYDVNLSSLTEASHANGGFEMSVVYTGGSKSSQKRMVPCPRL